MFDSSNVTVCSGRKSMSYEMVRRYAHLLAEHMAPYVDASWRYAALRAVATEADGTNRAQA